MSADAHPRGLVDTNILILRAWVDPDELPLEMAISAVTPGRIVSGTSRGPP